MSWLWLRYVERILVVLGGILAIYLGYCLYLRGIDQGDFTFTVERFVVSGQGPGLVFALAGFILLGWCVRSPVTLEHRKPTADMPAESVITVGEPTEPPDATKKERNQE